MKAFMLREHKEDGTHDFTLSSVQESVNQLIDGYQDRGQWWKTGPWLLDDPSAGNPNKASLKPPVVSTGTYNNWTPFGVDDAVAIEIEPDGGNVTLNGLKMSDGCRNKRMLLFRNRDTANSVFLKHENTGSLAQYRFNLPDATDVELAPGQNIWLYYDPNQTRWTAAITAQNAGGITSGVVNSGLVGGSSDFGFASVSLTSNNLDNLNGTPIQIVAAPGAGYVLWPLDITMVVNKLNSTTWTANPSFQVIHAGQTVSLATSGTTGLSGASTGLLFSHSPCNTSASYSYGTNLSNLALQVKFNLDASPNAGPPAGSATAVVGIMYVRCPTS